MEFWLLREIWNAIRDPEFGSLLLVVILALGTGTVVYNQVEGWSLFDSLYFSVITLTTVGHGELSPETDIGKAFTIMYLFIGIGLVLAFVNAISRRAQSRSIMNHLLLRKKSGDKRNLERWLK